MTAGCAGGGPSSARPGFGLSVAISATALAVKFANSASWLSVFIGSYIAAISYDLSTFCPNDPPALPVLDTPDFVDLVQVLNPVARATAQKKLQDWVGAMIWYDLCECTSGATPAAPTPQAPPADLPTVNPLLPGGLLAGPSCGYATATAGPFPTGGQGITVTHADVLPSSTTGVQLEGTSTVAGAGPHPDLQFGMFWLTSPAGTVVATQTLVIPSGQTVTQFFQRPAGANGYNLMVGNSGSPVCTDTVVLRVDFYCGNSPTGAVNCCPPDPQLLAQIQQVLDLVTLIQRQSVPFAYVPGTAHVGLTGAASFAIQGLLGVKVAVTTMPGPIGVEGTSPAEYFDLGFLTFGTADGYPQSVRLEHNPQVILPARCSAFTVLAYDLAPGAVVTITELKREP